MFICAWYLEKSTVIERTWIWVSPQACVPVSRSANQLTSLSLSFLICKIWAWDEMVFQMYELLKALQLLGIFLFHSSSWVRNPRRREKHTFFASGTSVPAPRLPGTLHGPQWISCQCWLPDQPTAPVVARRWHFGVFCNQRTNHRVRDHSGTWVVKTTKELYLLNLHIINKIW